MEDKKQVSLPGAGETEPTIIDQLNNFNLINQRLHEQTPLLSDDLNTNNSNNIKNSESDILTSNNIDDKENLLEKEVDVQVSAVQEQPQSNQLLLLKQPQPQEQHELQVNEEVKNDQQQQQKQEQEPLPFLLEQNNRELQQKQQYNEQKNDKNLLLDDDENDVTIDEYQHFLNNNHNLSVTNDINSEIYSDNKCDDDVDNIVNNNNIILNSCGDSSKNCDDDLKINLNLDNNNNNNHTNNIINVNICKDNDEISHQFQPSHQSLNADDGIEELNFELQNPIADDDNLITTINSIFDDKNSILNEIKNESLSSPSLAASFAATNSEIANILSNNKVVIIPLDTVNKDIIEHNISTPTPPTAPDIQSTLFNSRLSQTQLNSIESLVPSLREFLPERSISPPPLPPVTYRWEDVKRSKEKGGYPWTYLEPQPRDKSPKNFESQSDRKSIEKDNLNVDFCDQQIDNHIEIEDIQLNHTIEVTNNNNNQLDGGFDESENTSPIVTDENVNEGTNIIIDDDKSLNDNKEINTAPIKVKLNRKDSNSSETKKTSTILRNILKRAHPTKKLDINSTAEQLQNNDNKTESSEIANKQTNDLSPKKTKCCHPLVDKLKIMADKQFNKVSRELNKRGGGGGGTGGGGGSACDSDRSAQIRRIPLHGDDRIVLQEEHKILKLKESPKAERREFASYVEKRDSDEILDIVELDESPSEIRKKRESLDNDHDNKSIEKRSSLVIPDEIIDLPSTSSTGSITDDKDDSREPTIAEILEEELKSDQQILLASTTKTQQQPQPQPQQQHPPPRPPIKKPLRKKKEHVYEDIEDPELMKALALHKQNEHDNNINNNNNDNNNNNMFDNLQMALRADDAKISNELRHSTEIDEQIDTSGITNEDLQNTSTTNNDLDSIDKNVSKTDQIKKIHLMAPISSIDSTSSDECDRIPTQSLSAVSEETNEQLVVDSNHLTGNGIEFSKTNNGQEEPSPMMANDVIKSVLKRESSPGCEKKVTFSSSTENDPDSPSDAAHREDVELPEHIQNKIDRKWSNMSDHEYEPIGEPQCENEDNRIRQTSEPPTVHITEPDTEMTSDTIENQLLTNNADKSFVLTSNERKLIMGTSVDTDVDDNDNIELNAAEIQKQMEDKYFNSEPSARHPVLSKLSDDLKLNMGEDVNVAPEDQKKKTFMESANDHSKNIQQKLRNQAGRFRTWTAGKTGSKKQTIETTTPEVPQEPLTTTTSTTINPQRSSSASPQRQTESPPETPPASPTLKERKRFKSPEFSKLKNIQMPKINKPEFKRPEFTKFKKPDFKKISFPDRPKFSKPDMSKFKIPDRFSSLRLKSSVKEDRNGRNNDDDGMDTEDGTQPTTTTTTTATTTTTTDDDPHVAKSKKHFDFSSTYPRIFNRKKKERSSSIQAGDDGMPVGEETTTTVTTTDIEFGTVPRAAKKKTSIRQSRWLKKFSNASHTDSENSGKFQRYSSEPENLQERETSVERRMRLHLKKSNTDDGYHGDKNPAEEEDDEDDDESINRTDEQRQMDDYDKENRTIYKISRAREDEFRLRKPLVHQDSDLVSEEDTAIGMALKERQLKANIENDSDIMDKDRLSLTQTNQETQSSGSSSTRHRKGVIEEIDDDEFFLRQKGISQDDIQIGKYINSAIREGLDTSSHANALAQLAQHHPRQQHDRDSYYDDDDNEDDFQHSNEIINYGYDVPSKYPKRVSEPVVELHANDRHKIINSNNYADDDLAMNDGNYFKTFPPARPLRKHKKQYSEEDSQEDRMSKSSRPDENLSFYENEHMEGIEQPNILVTDDKDDAQFEMHMDNILMSAHPTPPPRAPKRKKRSKKSADKRDSLPDQLAGRSVSNNFIPNGNADDIVVYRTQHEYVIPLEQPQAIRPPSRGNRSEMSRATDDDRTSHGADSLILDFHPGDDDTKYVVEMKGTNGYAVVKKEPPPRPPAPIRRKRSTKSLGDNRQFATLPFMHQKEKDPSILADKPTRNYNTIGPAKPPRRFGFIPTGEDTQKTPSLSTSDVTQYEEIDDLDRSDSRNLHSGEVLNKMKYRPLPAPPRPPRERKQRKPQSSERDDDKDINNNNDAKYDRDDGAERMSQFSEGSHMSSHEIEEVEVSTQTDPLPSDYCYEEFEITDEMKVIETNVRSSKTLGDILREEQQAEIERANQLSDEQNLSRSINKFREANQRSMSERSRASTNDRPKTPASRPLTPSAIIIERKISLSTIETDARLIVKPILDEIDRTESKDDSEDVPYMEEGETTEDERIVNEALQRYRSVDVDEEPTQSQISQQPQHQPQHSSSSPPPLPPKTQQQHELKIEEHPQQHLQIPTASESEASNSLIEEHTYEYDEESPIPPPRRKSSTTATTVTMETIASPPTSTASGLQPATSMEMTPIHENQVTPDEHPPLENVLPNRLHVTELAVDQLNVNALQASRILVSDLQGISLNAQEFECKSGNLNVNGIQLPMDFLKEIVDRLATTTTSAAAAAAVATPSNNVVDENKMKIEDEILQQKHSDETDQEPPARPPPPQGLYPNDYLPYVIQDEPLTTDGRSNSQAFYGGNFSEDELQLPTIGGGRTTGSGGSPIPSAFGSPAPPSTTPINRRRRHFRRRDSTSDEDEHHESRDRRSRNSTRSSTTGGGAGGSGLGACGGYDDATIPELSGQLVRACGSSIGRAGTSLWDAFRANNKDEKKRRDLNYALCIIIVIIIAIMIMSMTGNKAIHHHHWDYFNPPDNDARN